MALRCPSCERALEPLGWTFVRYCDDCDCYVEPDGSLVEEAEGHVRRALLQVGEEPRTVAELRELLPGDDLALRELCRRHRARTQGALDALPLAEGVTIDCILPEADGYREPAEPIRVEARFQPKLGPPPRQAALARRAMRFLGPLMVISLAGVFLSTKLEGAPCSGFFVCLYLGLFPFTLYAAHRATPGQGADARNAPCGLVRGPARPRCGRGAGR